MRDSSEDIRKVSGLMKAALESIERAIAALDEAGTPSDIAAHLDLARTLLVIQIDTDMSC